MVDFAPKPRIARRALALAAALAFGAFAPPPGAARAGDPAPKPFPESWFGTWRGPGATRLPDGGQGPSFTQELAIGATDAPGRYTWTIRFESPEGRQERPYFLVAKDAAKGLYAIDEGHGVEIPATLVDGTLFTHFEVFGRRITTRDRVEGAGTPDERLEIETVTTVAGRQTVVGGKDDVPTITGWPIGNVQSSVLRRSPTAAAPRAPLDADLERLATYMTGEFSSEAQAKADAEYRDIRLTMARIWADRADGPWLYVEQAMASAPDRPYRQRVYRLEHAGADLFQSRVFALKEPAKAVGAGADPTRLAGVTPETLEALPGCTVVLRRIDAATFRGSTLGSACENAFGKAVYATSEVTITASSIRSWDRGYDAKAEQVWGATKGGYEFLRLDAPTAPKPPTAAPPPAPAARAPAAPPSPPTPPSPPAPEASPERPPAK